MDRMKLEQSVSNLLFDHDCVIIPDFGGLVVNYRPAHIHPKLNVITPPAKQVSFNRNLVNNDGLVANYISRKENISYDAAMAFLSKCVAEYQQVLENGKRLELENIGLLYKDKSGRLQFVPDQDINFLKSSFGLSKVYVQPVEEKTTEQTTGTKVISMTKESDKKHAELPVDEGKSSASPRRRWRVAAAAILIPAALVGGFLLKEYYSGGSNLNIASLNPLAQQTAKQSNYVPRIEDEDIVLDYEGDYNSIERIANSSDQMKSIYFSFVEDQISPDGIRVNLSESQETFVDNSPKGLNLYFVVGGAFAEKENAEKLTVKLRAKGFDASIFGKTGNLHMVCYGSYTTKSAARQALREIKQEENKHAWLKRH